MVNAALDGLLDDVPTDQERFFGLHIPLHCPNVPDNILNPRHTWANPADYDAQAAKLAGMFASNFVQFAGQISEEIRRAGPVG
jgi:phosphoenolpyruvate carboxykinase (ATP)